MVYVFFPHNGISISCRDPESKLSKLCEWILWIKQGVIKYKAIIFFIEMNFNKEWLDSFITWPVISIVEENMHAKLLTKTKFDMGQIMIHGAVPWPAVILGGKIINIPCRSSILPTRFTNLSQWNQQIYKFIAMKPTMVNFFAVSLHFLV